MTKEAQELIAEQSQLEEIDRLTATINVHHEHWGDQPVSASPMFSALLQTKDEVYARRLKISSEVPLDLGWVEKPGQILVWNITDQHPRVNPTDAEKKETARKILRIGDQMVRPGRFAFFEPVDHEIKVRSEFGVLTVRLWVYPR